ncbi:hypothetical protein I3760_05G143300 [Carya illinoinensis]|nr:hypothetical protein I3760_05G143300 [Carya illinoinensis]
MAKIISDDVKLLGAWPSVFVMRPRIALNIKSVDYKFLEETLGCKSQLLLQSNSVHKKVPVLIHAGKPICESLIIVQYIDEVWSSEPSILPSDPHDRAIARFWASYVDDKWFPSLRLVIGAEGERTAALIDQVTEGLVLLEEAFCNKKAAFFGGDHIGFLDIALGSMLGWLRVTENMVGVKLLDEAKTPWLVQWAENFCADAAVKGPMPQTEKLVEFAKGLLTRMRGS